MDHFAVEHLGISFGGLRAVAVMDTFSGIGVLGLALVIVRAAKGQSGAFTLRAESEGLAPAELKLQAN